MNDYKFGNFIYERRLAKGLSQAELGALLGVSNKAVSKWETGAAKPQTQKLYRLAEILEVSVEELLAGDLTQPKPPTPQPSEDTALPSSDQEPVATYWKELLQKQLRTARFASVFTWIAVLLFLQFLPVTGILIEIIHVTDAVGAIYASFSILGILVSTVCAVVFHISAHKQKKFLSDDLPKPQKNLTSTVTPSPKSTDSSDDFPNLAAHENKVEWERSIQKYQKADKTAFTVFLVAFLVIPSVLVISMILLANFEVRQDVAWLFLGIVYTPAAIFFLPALSLFSSVTLTVRLIRKRKLYQKFPKRMKVWEHTQKHSPISLLLCVQLASVYLLIGSIMRLTELAQSILCGVFFLLALAFFLIGLILGIRSRASKKNVQALSDEQENTNKNDESFHE